jgi:penicillin amidase
MKHILFLLTLLLGAAVLTVAQETPSSSRQLTGLRDQVIIRRDERGIPYVEAKNDEDLYFGQGYAIATDRLWQMDLFRRTARGELAEILGAGPNNAALEQDKQHRTLGFAKVAEAEFAQASPQTRKLLEAYAAGVNAYIDSLGPKSLPPEFQILNYKPQPWRPVDSLVAVKLFFEALSNTWRLDVMRQALSELPDAKRAQLLPVRSELDVLLVGTDSITEKRTASNNAASISQAALFALARSQAVNAAALSQIGLYAEDLAASNNWVVSGKRTQSGKPLLANDPHLTASAPPIWYLVHLSAPGVRVAGVTAAGLPGVVIGHNDRVAWGFTNVGSDVQDVYLEKFDSNNPNRYLTPSGWQDAVIRHEEIKVRKGIATSETDVVKLDVTETRHGPIVFENDGKRYSLSWTALNPAKNRADQSFALNRARNWNEFRKALESFTAPTQNVVYADVDGHIGYQAAGVVPIRKSGNGSVPYDGSTDAGEWLSYIPLTKLPHLYDPSDGIIVTANQRIVGSSYPYFLTESWPAPYRARRIKDLLLQKPKLTSDDFRRIQGDVYSIAGVYFTQQVAKILTSSLTDSDEKLRSTLKAFEGWDGMMAEDSRVAAWASQMRLAFRSRILTAALGPELVKNYQWNNFDTTLDRVLKDQPKEWLPKEFQSYADLLRACYDDAVKSLTRQLGSDESNWTWGAIAKARFPHPLGSAPLIGPKFSIPPIPQNGTGGLLGATVNVGSAVSMRLIAEPGNWDQTQHGISLGESGDPSSQHWTDQLQDWRNVTPRVFPFTQDAVTKATKEVLTLEPKP